MTPMKSVSPNKEISFQDVLRKPDIMVQCVSRFSFAYTGKPLFLPEKPLSLQWADHPPMSPPYLSLDLCESILSPSVSPAGLSSLPFLFLVFIPTDISRVFVHGEESSPGLLSGLSPDSVLRNHSSLGSGVCGRD